MIYDDGESGDVVVRLTYDVDRCSVDSNSNIQ